MTILHRKCVRQSKMHDEWRKNYLQPIFKRKGSATDPKNYRDIALTSVLYKILTPLIVNRLYPCVEDKIPAEQYGFLKRRSTSDAVEFVLNHVSQRLSNKKMTYAAFIGFQTAFDCLPRDRLFDTLRKRFNITGPLFNLVHNILAHNIIWVKNGDHYVQTPDTNHRGSPGRLS